MQLKVLSRDIKIMQIVSKLTKINIGKCMGPKIDNCPESLHK
jgi:hypothetical protein